MRRPERQPSFAWEGTPPPLPASAAPADESAPSRESANWARDSATRAALEAAAQAYEAETSSGPSSRE
eukprot:4272649-Prymnesium_polylepis.1